MSTLFHWPEAARVGRVIPKERLYAEAGVTASTKQRFVDEVQRIRWAYKLGEESVRLRGSDDVPEIQIFEVDLKGTSIADSVLTAIDKSIPSPIVFELHRSSGGHEEIQFLAAHKRRAQRGPKVSGYFRGDWTPAGQSRLLLPQAIDLAGLYGQLLTTLMPVSARPGEELSAVVDRVTWVHKLEREISALDNRLRIEPQFNRRVELRRELRAREAELDSMKNENGPTAEDATWRS